MYNSWTKINASGGTYIVMAFANESTVNSNGVKLLKYSTLRDD